MIAVMMIFDRPALAIFTLDAAIKTPKDLEGKRVLTKLFREGAFFRTAGAMTCSVVDEITGKSAKPWRGILTQSIVLLLVVSVARGAADPPAAPRAPGTWCSAHRTRLHHAPPRCAAG